MQIRGRPIGHSHPPYVIAEVSCNHAGSESVAMALIDVAKQSGADAVKFQFYTPEGMVGPKFQQVEISDGVGATRENDYIIGGGPWSGETMHSLYSRSQMPWAWGPRLKQRCHDLDLAFIASAYDLEGLEWLMQNCKPDALKVASFEATDRPFVDAVKCQGLPVIISTGMMSRDEREMYEAVVGSGDTVVLHCVSAYPTLPSDAGLGVLGPDYHGYDPICLQGFSDHTIGHSVACAAVAKGACVLEKHIQLSPFLKTADSHFSSTPDEFSLYCKAVREAWEACQPVVGDPEKDSRQFRRAPGGKRGSYGQ